MPGAESPNLVVAARSTAVSSHGIKAVEDHVHRVGIARDLRKSKVLKTLDTTNRMVTAHGKNVRSIGEDGFDSSAQCQPEVSPVAIYYHFKAFPQASCCAPGDGSQLVSIRGRQ